MTLLDTTRKPQHHIEFTKDAVTIALDLCNGAGEFDELAIQKEQQARVSIKMHQGGTKHSDYEPPYGSVEQRDWSGGRGLDDLDEDETRYSDGYRCETWRAGRAILGPRANYGVGYRNADTNMWNTIIADDERIQWIELSSDIQYRSVKFVASASYDAYYGNIILRRSSSTATPADIRVALYDDNGGEPGSELYGVNTGEIVEANNFSEIIEVYLGSTSLTSGTTYHLVVNWRSGDDTYYVGMAIGSNGMSSDEGGGSINWESSPYEMWFRVKDVGKATTPFFFRYSEALMAFMSYDDGTAPKLYINGDYGRATGATNTTLTDSSKSWTTNEFQWATVVLTSGEGAAIVDRTRLISSNTGDTLTVVPAWEDQPNETSSYAIIATDRWQEITGHGITSGPITDVLSYNQLIYVMLGDDRALVRGRYPGLAGGGWAVEAGNNGTFITVAPDSQGQQKIWKAIKRWVSRVDKATPVWGMGGSEPSDLDFGTTELVTNGDMELDSDWLDVGTPTTNERSTTQVYAGTYSRHVVCDADDEGIGQTLTLTSGDHYRVTAKVYLVSGSLTVELGGEEIEAITTTDEWIPTGGYRKATGASEDINFLSDGGAAEFYIDDASVLEEPTYLTDIGYDRITGLIGYGDPKRLWVGTTAGLYREDNGELLPLPINEEFRNAGDERNCAAMLAHDVYLYISFLDGLERYYEGNLDDVGPNRNEGLPISRRGRVSALMGYPGRIYAAINAGTTGYDSVMLYNGVGWHEVYRHPNKYEQIKSLFIEPVPGENISRSGPGIDRLWVGVGADLLRFDVDLYPTKNEDYRYHWESWFETAWIYYGKKDVEKYYAEVKIFFERLVADTNDTTEIYMQYKVDDDTTWKTGGTADTPAGDTIEMPYTLLTGGVVGKRVKFRIMLRTTDMSYTPILNAQTHEFIEQVPTKDAFTMTFIAQDNKITLQGSPSYDRIETDLGVLEGWVNDPDPVTMYSQLSLANLKKVKLLSLTYRPLAVDPLSQKERLLCTLTAIET